MSTDPSTAAWRVAPLALLPESGWLYVVDVVLGLAVAVLIAAVVRVGLARRAGADPAGTAALPAGDDLAPLRRREQLGASLDLDDVLMSALKLLVDVPGISAAAIVLQPQAQYGEEHAPLAATIGMEPDELAGLPLDWPHEEVRPTRVTVAYEYEVPADSPITGGMLRPLPGELMPSGTAAVLWRGGETPTTAALATADGIIVGATIPIENARRHRAAVVNAEIDPLTRLYNRRYFHEMLVREIARTQRYGRQLTIVILDVDGFKALNERLGHLACDAILADVGASIRAVVRTSDVACRVGGDEFGVILTEAGALDAEHFFQRLRFGMNSDLGGERLTLSGGAAELRPEDDSVKLFERADAALFEAKRSGRDKIALADNEAGRSDSETAGESA